MVAPGLDVPVAGLTAQEAARRLTSRRAQRVTDREAAELAPRGLGCDLPADDFC